MSIEINRSQFSGAQTLSRRDAFQRADSVRLNNGPAQDEITFAGGRATSRVRASAAGALVAAALALFSPLGGTPASASVPTKAPAATATADTDKADSPLCISPEEKTTSNGAWNNTNTVDDYFQGNFKTMLPIIKACDIESAKLDNGANNAAPIYQIELSSGAKYWFFVPDNPEDQQALEETLKEKDVRVEYGTVDISKGGTSPLAVIMPFVFMAVVGGAIFFMIRQARKNGGMGGLGMGMRGGMGGMGGPSDQPWQQIIGSPIRFNSVGGYPEVVTQLKDVLSRYEANLEGEKLALINRQMDAYQKALDNPQTTKPLKKQAEKRLGELQKKKDALGVSEKNDEIDIDVEPTNGVLFYGPPGTGKSLMAEAVSGEAGVPFLSISGSDFVNQLVGRGAANVRALYANAKQMADQYGGCIVFVDEVDSIAGRRNNNGTGGDTEREATLNALLACMSGPQADRRILWMAATNRKDMIDDAILRPGRLTEHIQVTAPKEAKGRKEIILIYAQKYIDKGVMDPELLDVVAEMTSGFTGAQLKEVINSSAVFAKQLGKKTIDKECFAEAILKTLIGIPFDTMDVPNDEHRRVLAHEGLGHALAALVEPISLDLFTVSARPRGDSMGHVSYSPEKLSKFLTRRDEMLKLMLIAAAGRAAEEVCYGGKEVTGGWAGDLQQLKERYRSMMDVGLLSNDITDSTDPRTGMTHQDREFRSDVIMAAVDTHRKLLELAPPEMRESVIDKMQGLGKRELVGAEATSFMMEALEGYPWEEAAKIVEEYLNTSFDGQPLYNGAGSRVESSAPVRLQKTEAPVAEAEPRDRTAPEIPQRRHLPVSDRSHRRARRAGRHPGMSGRIRQAVNALRGVDEQRTVVSEQDS